MSLLSILPPIVAVPSADFPITTAAASPTRLGSTVPTPGIALTTVARQATPATVLSITSAATPAIS